MSLHVNIAPSIRCQESNPSSYLYGDHSVSHLKISRKMLVRILSYHQVMPNYLDFLLLFGTYTHSRDQRFSGFREQMVLSPGKSLKVDSLGRSGNQYQLCYNLKSVARWTEPGQLMPSEDCWLIRQGAFHHQFDLGTGTSLWIVTRSGLDIKQRVEDLTSKSGRIEDRQFGNTQECLRSSLAVHSLFCHWSTENWQTYFQWLEDTIEQEVSIFSEQMAGTAYVTKHRRVL